MNKNFTRRLLTVTAFLFSILWLNADKVSATTPVIGTTTFDNNFSATGNLLGTTSTTGTVLDVGNPSTSTNGILASGWNFTVTATGATISMSCAAAGAIVGGTSDFCIRMNSTTSGVSVTSAGVKSNDGSAFALQSVYFKANIIAGAPATIMITGYRNGSPVSGATSTVSGINTATWTLFNVSSISAFQDIDEFRFTQSGTSATLSFVVVDQITIGPTTPLPLTLTDFNASVQGKNILLNWVTASEQNTDYFDIQKSIDGEAFGSIGRQVAAGNSNAMHSYKFSDDNLNTNSSSLLYRLKLVDRDGGFVYSKVAMVNVQSAQSFVVQATPNPFFSVAAVTIVSPVAGQGILNVCNAGGQSLLKQFIAFQNGTNTISIPGSEQLAKGIYYVNILVGNKSQTIKVIKL